MTINFTNNTIEMTKTESKAASKFGSDMYKQLQEARRDYPTYTVVQRTIKRNPNKECYKGLTYEYIENYIESHCSEKMSEYREMRLLAECHSVRYPEIKKWFLKTFPEVAMYGTDRIENTLSISKVETMPNAA